MASDPGKHVVLLVVCCFAILAPINGLEDNRRELSSKSKDRDLVDLLKRLSQSVKSLQSERSRGSNDMDDSSHKHDSSEMQEIPEEPSQHHEDESCDCDVSACSQIDDMRGPNGVIKSPGFDDDHYPNNGLCRWRIIAPTGYTITIVISIMDIEFQKNCDYDNVTVYDGKNTSVRILGKFCGHQKATLHSSGNHAFVVFQTDQSVNHGRFEIEWELSHENSTNPCMNGVVEEMTFPEGIIRSPGYFNSEYPNNADCKWRITAPIGKAISLQLDVLDIEGGLTCEYDNLTMYDGNSTTAPNLGTACGRSPISLANLIGNQLTTSNYAFIRFLSDSTIHYGRFSVTWKFADQAPQGTGVSACGKGHVEQFMTETGSVKSPGLLNYSYPLDIQCRWLIVAPTGSTISVTVKDLHLEPSNDCIFDSLTFYDGGDGSAPVLGKYCGKAAVTIQSTGNEVFVAFVSDHSISAGGFIFEWTIDHSSRRELGSANLKAANELKANRESGLKSDDKDSLVTLLKQVLHKIEDEHEN